jgi:hypothetical protein
LKELNKPKKKDERAKESQVENKMGKGKLK